MPRRRTLKMRVHQVTTQLRKSKRKAEEPSTNVLDIDSNTDKDRVWIKVSDLEKLAREAADANKPEQQLAAVRAVRILLSSNGIPPIDDVINSNVLFAIVDCMKQPGCESLHFEAAWLLAIVASGSAPQIREVVLAGAVPHLVQLLYSPDKAVCRKAVCALINIIRDNTVYRDYAIEHGFVVALVSLIQPETSSMLLQVVSLAFVNLCRLKVPPPPDTAVNQILPVIDKLIQQHTNVVILTNTVWAVTYLTRSSNAILEMLVKSGMMTKLVSLLECAEVCVLEAVLCAIGKIVDSNDNAQIILDHGLLKYFPALLSHRQSNIRNAALAIVSNIATMNKTQLQAVIDAGVLAGIIANLSSNNFELQAETAYTVTNLIATGSGEQVFALIEQGVIKPFCKLLACKNADVIRCVLCGLKDMLELTEIRSQEVALLIEECGGLKLIEETQNHENDEIFKLSYRILDKYFNDEAEEICPESTQEAFLFSSGDLPPMNVFKF